MDINTQNIITSNSVIEKLVYLRRTYEILNAKGHAYQLISNVFHKRDIPVILENQGDRQFIKKLMTENDISVAETEILGHIPEFNYESTLIQIKDDEAMKALYRASDNNYEKLHLYRIIFDDKGDSINASVIQKFINQAFHIENDYIYQLNCISSDFI